ncbi:DMT family transporter [Bacillus cereus group sp. TH260-2LC]|uniref:DMT family transporter n=1 Tax=unclassified Bacillus cereus group TaxID=2750818 RepID=UPI0022E26196|nr:DMT family transporter [Bacillus cereus group sp. TH260-2LC]MDA1529164.1 DMT family transporter [Bacillus cereus group sp. TH260-2LC]
MKSPILSYCILFFGVFALSTSAIFVKLADAPAAIIAFYRLLFAALILLPLLLFNKNNRNELKIVTRRQWGFGFISGLFLAAHYILWFESLQYTSVASSTVIVTLQPLFSMIGGYFLFKERFTNGAIIGCLIAISGSIVIGWQDFQISGEALYGDILAFIAAGIITVYFFISQHVRKDVSLIPYSVISYGSSACFLGIFAYMQNESFIHYSTKTWLCFIGLAFIATILGQTIFNWLLKWMSATVISMSILGETIGTCILAYFILNETISLQQGLGITVIFIGLALFLLQPNSNKKA